MKSAPYPWGQTTIPRGQDIAITECHVLWLAIIERAFDDAKWNPDNSAENSRCSGMPRTQMINARADALRWLRGTTADFKEVCENAGVHPDRVKQRALDQIGGEAIWGQNFESNYFLSKEAKQRATKYFRGTTQGADT